MVPAPLLPGDTALLPVAAPSETAILPVQAQDRARDDAQLVALWRHGRSPATQRAYAADLGTFRALVPAPLREVTLGDLQAYQDSLAAPAPTTPTPTTPTPTTLAPATQARRLGTLKSLLSFGHKTGYLAVNVGAAIRLPRARQTLSERILDVDAVLHLLALERHPRNKALLRLLYLGGLRISELCQLRGRDLAPRDGSGQVTVFGKGGKTRAVLLKDTIWQDLMALRGDNPETPLFRSREGGGALDPSQVHRIVKQAARRAGLSAAVSAHWLRHAHVSHALDRGAPVHLVQTTVGHASLTTTSRYAHARPDDSSSRYLPG